MWFDLVVIFAAMQVHKGTDHLPAFRNAVITIGTFDGVHVGHRTIINTLKTEAERIGGEAVIITFDPHPRKIINANESLQLINTLAEKIELLSRTGVDHLVVVPFNEHFASQSADEYIQDFLIANFHPHTIIIGYDHHFGKNRQGNYRLLEQKADKFEYQLIEIPKLMVDEIGVSSTKIRNALLDGKVQEANKLLGYNFFFEGKVIHGDKLGRKLGYPTANLMYTDPDKIHLAEGVYAAYAVVGGRKKGGMLSIGNRPTIENSDQRVEINIFDFDEEIYGETVRVMVKAHLRPQEKYSSLDELVKQLDLDKRNSLAILG